MASSVKTFIFMGKPGSGKGTQAKLLAKHLGFPVFAAGETLRAMAKEDTLVGRRIAEDIDAGRLVPHWLASFLFQRGVFSVSEESGIIFDGFGRKKEEAQLLSETMAWLSRPYRVIHLVVSDEEIRRRIDGRSEEEVRADDETVDVRLLEYRTHTEPAIKHFVDCDVVINIDGEQTPEQVAASVIKEVQTVS
jgi:adenylate kinase